jgi:hypothetical protein
VSLETPYLLSRIAAVIAIIATLFAILWQGNLKYKTARADLSPSMRLQMGAMHDSIVGTPEKGDLFARAFSDADRLTEGEKIRLSFNLSMLIGAHEAAFNPRSRGLIGQAVYDRSAATTRTDMTFAIMRRWWKRNRDNGYSAAYWKKIDALTEEIEIAAAAGTPDKAPAAI